MAVFGAVVGAVIGGVAGAVTSLATSSKQANAYARAARQLKEAADKYSGDAAYNSIKASGYDNARDVNSAALQLLSRINQDNPLRVQNFQNAENNISNYDQTQANTAGRERQASKLNALYNRDTAHAQNLLKQAGIEANAMNQAYKEGMGAIGTMANVYNQARNPTSDERCKAPINNESGLPKSDIEDSLRQIETVQYQYKDPNQPGADNEIHESGVTAQSLEKTPLFKDAVVDGNPKKIDQWKLQEALTAGIAQLQREIDELERDGK